MWKMLAKHEAILCLVVLAFIFSIVWQSFVFLSLPLNFEGAGSLNGKPDKSKDIYTDLMKLLDGHFKTAKKHQSRKPSKNSHRVPSFRHELLLQRISRNIQDYLNFIKYEKLIIEIEFRNKSFKFPSFLDNVEEYRWPLLEDLALMKQKDGFELWRKNEFKRLGSLVQRRISLMQNPSDCSKARKLICQHRMCGFSCTTHHLVNCLSFALGTQRTFVLQPTKYRNYEVDFYEVFANLSEKCLVENSTNISVWPAPDSERVIKLWTTYTGNPGLEIRPKFFPRAVPVDLAKSIEKIHGKPDAWWVGQLLKFTLRPTKETQNFMDQNLSSLEFEKPIVGVHVRRTDKTEDGALYYPLKEYMRHVEEFYDRRKPDDLRLVYLATDDPNVLIEATNDYPDYEFITNQDATKTAERLDTRYSKSSFYGILLDIHILAMTDFLVCTFSSEVCRLSFELMQANSHFDASANFKSLDYIYHYNEQLPQYYRAVLPHTPRLPNEFGFKVGDLIEEVREMVDGYGLISAIHNDTRRKGMIPRFKLRRVVETVKFPN